MHSKSCLAQQKWTKITVLPQNLNSTGTLLILALEVEDIQCQTEQLHALVYTVHPNLIASDLGLH